MTSIEPRYIPLIQKPSCCSAACLQMILYRNGFGLHDQEWIAIEFGVRVREKYAHAFTTAMPVIDGENSSYGIKTVESAGRINQILTKSGFRLHAESVKFSDISSIEDFLINGIQMNWDLWVEYHANNIHRYDENGGDYVHDGLIEGFDPSTGDLTIIDPVPTHRQRITVSLSDLSEAISSRFGEETGFIVLKPAIA